MAKAYVFCAVHLLTYTVGLGRIKPAIYPKRLKIGLERNLLLTAYIQESCAIAKVTAQCALYMGALKIFGTPCQSLTTPTAIISNIFRGKCPIIKNLQWIAISSERLPFLALEINS